MAGVVVGREVELARLSTVLDGAARRRVKHKGVDGSAACNFDSGSPLFLGDQLIAVVSEGDAACSSLTVSARLDLPEVSSWLLDQVSST